MKKEFENWILRTRIQTQPWSLIEPNESGKGYLDLYTQKQWEGWQAAFEFLNQRMREPDPGR